MVLLELALGEVNTVVSKPLADVYFIGITVLIAAYFQMAAFRQSGWIGVSGFKSLTLNPKP